MNIEKKSPFEPRNPVSPEKFEGRNEILKYYIRYFPLAVIENIKDSFGQFLYETINNIEDKNGLFIIIDDINGLSETPDFTKWYKSFADSISTN